MRINVVPEKPKKRAGFKAEKTDREKKRKEAKAEVAEEPVVAPEDEPVVEEDSTTTEERPKAKKLGLASKGGRKRKSKEVKEEPVADAIEAEIVDDDLVDFEAGDDGSLSLSFILLLVCSIAIMFVVGFTGGSIALRMLGVIP